MVEKQQNPPRDIVDRVDRALFDIVLDHPFLGFLSSMLQRQYVRIPDFFAATNGDWIKLDVDRVREMTDKQLRGLIAHEVLHCALEHVVKDKWSAYPRRDVLEIAMEYIVNHFVRDIFRYDLPSKPVYSPKYADGSWTEATIYQDLLQREENTGKSGGREKSSGGSSGGSQSGNGGSGSPDDQNSGSGGSAGNLRPDLRGGGKDLDDHGALSEGSDGGDADGSRPRNDWGELVAQAATVARMRGKIPAGLERLIGLVLKRKLDLRALLADFLRRERDRFDWKRPNKRTAWRGIYTPGRRSIRLVVGVAIDTSGSMRHDDIAEGLGIVKEVVESFDDYELHLFACDATVHHHQVVTREDEIDFGPLSRGGGGTDFRPVFDLIEKEDIQVEGLVYFTDTQGEFPAVPPPYPVLWICKGTEGFITPPFGESVFVDTIA